MCIISAISEVRKEVPKIGGLRKKHKIEGVIYVFLGGSVRWGPLYKKAKKEKKKTRQYSSTFVKNSSVTFSLGVGPQLGGKITNVMVSFETSNGLCSGVSFHIFTTSSDGSDTPHQRLTIMVYSVIKMSSIPFVYDILMDDVSFRIFYGIHGHLITRKLIETPSMDEKLLKV